MPYEHDDLGLRIIGYNTPIRFYDPTRTLRAEIYLQPDNTLNVGGLTAGGSGSTSAGGTHGLGDLAIHTGVLADAQAPQFLKIDGTRALTGNLTVNAGVTIDGVDLSAHAAAADAHHAGFIGLEDNAGTAVTPAVDDRIQLLTGNTILGIAAGTNTVTFTVNQANIDHGSIAGLGDDDHPQYAAKAKTETITGIWTLGTDTPLRFRDAALAILSSADGQLDIDADITVEVTSPTIELVASTKIAVQSPLLEFNQAARITTTSGNLLIAPATNVVTVTGSILPSADSFYSLGTVDAKWNEMWVDELYAETLGVGSSLTINYNAPLGVSAAILFEHSSTVQAYITWNGVIMDITRPLRVSGALTIDGTLSLGAGNKTVSAEGDLVLQSGASNHVKVGSAYAGHVVYSVAEPAVPSVGMIWVDIDA